MRRAYYGESPSTYPYIFYSFFFSFFLFKLSIFRLILYLYIITHILFYVIQPHQQFNTFLSKWVTYINKLFGTGVYFFSAIFLKKFVVQCLYVVLYFMSRLVIWSAFYKIRLSLETSTIYTLFSYHIILYADVKFSNVTVASYLQHLST